MATVYQVTADGTKDLSVKAEALTAAGEAQPSWTVSWTDKNETWTHTPTVALNGVSSVAFVIPAADVAVIAALDITCTPNVAKPDGHDRVLVTFNGPEQNPRIQQENGNPAPNPTVDPLVALQTELIYVFP